MHRLVRLSLFALILGVMGCAEGKYPLSDDQCGPDDPVLDLDAHDCTLPSG